MAFKDLFSIRKPADSPPADSPPQEVPLQKLEWESAKVAPVVVPPPTAPIPPAGQAPHAGAAFAPLPEMGGDPLFQIFVLGTRSAGKTVLLASLYRMLSVQDSSGNNFRLTCDFNSQKQLDETFDRIADPQQDWPPGSTGIDEYIFDCVHNCAGKDIPLFKFRYFDFPGGFISNARTPEEWRFIHSQVRVAHSILVLLDGKKIKNTIEKIAPPPKEPSLFQDSRYAYENSTGLHRQTDAFRGYKVRYSFTRTSSAFSYQRDVAQTPRFPQHNRAAKNQVSGSPATGKRDRQ